MNEFEAGWDAACDHIAFWLKDLVKEMPGPSGNADRLTAQWVLTDVKGHASKREKVPPASAYQHSFDIPWVRTYEHKAADGTTVVSRQTFVFQRSSWPHGGYTVSAQCQGVCNEHWTAGGKAGEEKLIQWASKHICGENVLGDCVVAGDEGNKPFRD